MKFASLLFLSIFVLASAHAQSPCPPGDAARAAMLPLGPQNKLLAHKIATDVPEFEAPADVGRDIVMLRKTLDVATQAFFHCEAGDDINPASLQKGLSAFLHTNESKRPEFGSQPYGANLTASVESADGFTNSVYVVLTFEVECGDDKLLFLYSHNTDGWYRRLHWYADSYSGPADAFQFVDYKTVAGRNPNEQLIALIHGHAQCASVHTAFTLELALPASISGHEEILDHLDHTFVIDDEFTVTRTSTGLQVRTALESEDSSLIWHHGILRFNTNTGKLTLLPVALNARDFVDEWLEEPWNTVKSWSDQADLIHLKDAHKTTGGTFGPVRSCKSSTNQFQVELDPDNSHALLAQVRQNPNSFTMLSITDKPDPTCTGPDLMKKRVRQPKQ
jgi:hypothetical protein